MIAFVFPGQGSQYPGMGKQLVATYPRAKEVFEQADSILGWPLSSLCFNGPAEELSRTSNCQPAIFTLNCAYLSLFEAVRPDYLAGHSLGEYSALVASKALFFEETLRLVKIRAELMDQAAQAQPGTMVAVLGINGDLVEEVLQKHRGNGIVEIANYNCPGQVVISGEKEVVERLIEPLKEAGAKRLVKLATSGAFHSPLVKSIESRFAQALEEAPFRQAEIPIVCNYTGRPAIHTAELKTNLARQVSSPVLWEKSVLEMVASGVELFIELGPGKVLQGLIRRISPGVRVFSVEEVGIDEIKRLVSWD